MTSDSISQNTKIEEIGGVHGVHVNIVLDEVAIEPNETHVR